AAWGGAGSPAPPRRRSRAPWPPPRACYSWSRSWTANVTRRRTRQALTAPSSISAVTPAISAWRRPSMVDAARFTARPTASSIELVEVPVSVIVFSTIEVSSRRRWTRRRLTIGVVCARDASYGAARAQARGRARARCPRPAGARGRCRSVGRWSLRGRGHDTPVHRREPEPDAGHRGVVSGAVRGPRRARPARPLPARAGRARPLRLPHQLRVSERAARELGLSGRGPRLPGHQPGRLRRRGTAGRPPRRPAPRPRVPAPRLPRPERPGARAGAARARPARGARRPLARRHCGREREPRRPGPGPDRGRSARAPRRERGRPGVPRAPAAARRAGRRRHGGHDPG